MNDQKFYRDSLTGVVIFRAALRNSPTQQAFFRANLENNDNPATLHRQHPQAVRTHTATPTGPIILIQTPIYSSVN